jgi:hypothetical protein
VEPVLREHRTEHAWIRSVPGPHHLIARDTPTPALLAAVPTIAT